MIEKSFSPSVEKNGTGRWSSIGRTYEIPFPPPYRNAQTSGEHQALNDDCLMLFERMLRAGEAGLEPDGTDSGDRPYFLASPDSTVTSAGQGIYHAIGKSFGHIFEGEIGISAKPEHIRIFGMTIMNPAVLDGIASTTVTPIPMLLMAVASSSSPKSRKAMIEAAAILAGGPP